jgi:hypothetical protein
MSTLISKIEETKLKWQKEWKERTMAGIIRDFSKGA